MNHVIVCHNPVQAHQVLTNSFWPWLKAMTSAGNKIAVRGEPFEDALTEKQRGYLHAAVFPQIAQQVVDANGERHHWRIWKEYFRAKFLGNKRKTFINPITGKKTRRNVRVSTEDLGVRAYAKYIDQVTAFAATELGVTITIRFEDYEVDA